MVDLKAELGDDRFSQLMRGIALGHYKLLLGAGASAGSHDQHGVEMPVGSALRNEIAHKFDIPDAADKTLKRVYALAADRVSSDGMSMPQYMKNRFTQTTPAPWLLDMLRVQWSTIWTLNIDDTVEAAANQLGAGRRQLLHSISWTDAHYQADRRKDELLLVHLHGKAHRAQKAAELIFDISGYTNSLNAHHRWLKIFGDDYPAKPFVVIGASIDEEIDLQDIFDEGKLSNPEFPSLIVLKDIDAFQAQEYERYGLISIKATGSEFMNAVRAALPEHLAKLTDDELGITETTPNESLRFLDQWKRLKLTPETRRPKGHHLFLGHEPNWFDATHGYLSQRPVVKKGVDAIKASHVAQEARAFVVLGDAFSGKSSALLRLALELIEGSYRPWIFVGDQALDVEAALYWLVQEPKAVLLIDNAADFARDVQALLQKARERQISAQVVLVERARRTKHIRDALVTEPVTEMNVPTVLSDQEIKNLVETLEAKRRMGVLTNMRMPDRYAYFQRHERKLFSAMAALEDGRGYHQRVADELAGTSSRTHRALMASVSLTSRLGYPLPYELTKTSADLTSVEAQALVNGDLADLLEARSSGITTRHRIFGEILIQQLSMGARKSAVVQLALAVAPYVSPQAIRAATLHYRIARGLMGTEILGELLGADHNAILGIYEELQEAYDWNARYWDQRALAAADAHEYEQAFSWAEQAVLRKRDALSLTTTGKVLMLRAVNDATKFGTWPTTVFEKAEENLAAARRMEGSRAEYPIETFFTYLLRLVRAISDRDPALNEQLRLLWSTWFTAILELEPASQLRLERVRVEALKEYELIWPLG